MQLNEVGNAVCYERWVNKTKMNKIGETKVIATLREYSISVF